MKVMWTIDEEKQKLRFEGMEGGAGSSLDPAVGDANCCTVRGGLGSDLDAPRWGCSCGRWK